MAQQQGCEAFESRSGILFKNTSKYKHKNNGLLSTKSILQQLNIASSCYGKYVKLRTEDFK